MASFKHTTNPTCQRAITLRHRSDRITDAFLDDLVEVSLWGHVEASVCVILACIPQISIFVMRTYRKYAHRTAESPRSGPSSAERGDGNGPTLALFNASEQRRPESVSRSAMSEIGRSSDSKFGSAGASVSPG